MQQSDTVIQIEMNIVIVDIEKSIYRDALQSQQFPLCHDSVLTDYQVRVDAG